MGAARGGMALPLAFLYGLVGWLAGVHGEKTRDRWTFPLVGLALAALLTALDAKVGGHLLGQMPTINWMLASVAWSGAASLLLVFVRR